MQMYLIILDYLSGMQKKKSYSCLPHYILMHEIKPIHIEVAMYSNDQLRLRLMKLLESKNYQE